MQAARGRRASGGGHGMARVLIFVGGITLLPESGRPTGMYKLPVRDVIELGHTGFAGDQQADLRVHGGLEKAVHLYPARHYAKLAARFPDAARNLVPGSLGENLSCDELDERDVRIGDIWQLGEARLQVCQPRNPCWKIDERFASQGMAAFIDDTCLTGWYWRVLHPGRVTPSDTLDLLTPAEDALTLHAAMALWRQHRPPLQALEHLANTPGVASGWRDEIERRLTYLKKLS